MPSLKHYPRLKLYKYNDRLVYNPDTQIATSYKWYEIYKVINGIRCLNTHGYSVTTSKHVSILRQFFNHCRDEIFYFEAPDGLQNLSRAINHYQNKINDIQVKLDNPRSRKNKIQDRLDIIAHYTSIIQKITQLQESRGI